MIISSGSLKFKKITTIKGKSLRPTSNKVRQAIFNILKHKLNMDKWKSQSFMLDAFAGTGIVAFEALSRGLLNATLIEKERKTFTHLVENVNNLGLSKRVNTINDNFLKIKNFSYKYKLIYLDPPYYKDIINQSLEKIMDMKLLEKKSIIICETEKNFNFDENKKKYIIFNKIYGVVKLTFFKYI
ncbi:MAG: Ribosomal RNA small subunit methyltransferase D [Alphaproteobacteria bacterium MarineAlpha9_Bin4]|nr:16S rRNA (guanine(966)-N(2))-methyltransferase RsmD [Pelagibacterales bacterium]PPR26645.1 MAG: Ribosomal RNA small subunit methyltransferase D [Alphaproteobacteria bacterium MarineAlpha9_Bin4]|tara:strand:- start:9 stop:563 length:555 start_codon:yes stop_codon:yes gene_type:complete